MTLKYKILTAIFSLILVTLAGACASNEPKQAKGISQLYEVHHDGRIHVFYDRALYLSYLKVGETPFRLTRIGSGPHGETMVFGLTKHDKKMKKPIPAIELYDGKGSVAEPFYAEMRKHGRIYVFNNFNDMKTVRQFGHPNFFYTNIGAGPNGETVVYVLNKNNKKKRPEGLIAQFKKVNS